jgi:poly(3-hydroxybutyrate) depolymerase
MMGNTMNISHNTFSYRSLTVAARFGNLLSHARATGGCGIRRRGGCLLLLVALLCGLAGCPQYADPTAPEPIRKLREPVSAQNYFLYVPSRYDSARPVPLVVLCHGTTPWDTALREIRDWVGLAEAHNFIVAAPKLRGTRGDLPPPVAKQIERQHRDERTILNVVQHVRGAYSIARTRIFIAGWSAGGYAVLHTGMRHPEIFRGLAIMQGNFKPEFFSDVIDRIDPYQPVFVLYGTTDVLTGGQGRDCVRWLYDHNAYVFDGKVPGPHRAHPELAHEFFTKVVREVPLLRIRAYAEDATNPYRVRFKVRASFEPIAFDWDLGDGTSDPTASPTHTYDQPGTYEVTLIATRKGKKKVRRIQQITVPMQTLEHALDD